jgi:membrane protein YdbS with pleckstrin-like domain
MAAISDGDTFPEPDQRLPPAAVSYWRVRALAGAVPAVGVGVWLATVLPGAPAVLVLVATVAAAAVTVAAAPPLRHRRWRYAIRDDEIDLRHGLLVTRRTLVPMRRVQHVETETGPLQSAYGLASVSFHTAAGSLTIPALAGSQAAEVRARIARLAAAETDDGAP